MKTIYSIIKDKVNTSDKDQALALENLILSMLIPPLLLIGSVLTFVLRCLVLHEDIAVVLTDSFIFILTAVLIKISIKLHMKERRKEDILNILIIFILIYFQIRFFYLLESAVFVLSYVFVVISLVKNQLKTTISIAVAAWLMIQHTFFYTNSNLDILEPFQVFIAHSASFIIFTLVSCIIHAIIITQQRLIKLSEQKLSFTIKSAGDGIITVKNDGTIDFMNPVAEGLTGWSNEEACGKPFETVFCIINEFTKETENSPVQEVFEIKDVVQLENHTLLISKDGRKISIEDTAAPIKDDKDTIIGCVVLFRDRSEIKMKQKEIEYLSYHDQLTGLFNRRYYEAELLRLDKEEFMPLSFIYADIDGLKMINDAFGHDRGDEVIKKVADFLSGNCRLNDTIARIGGDEFIIQLPNTRNTDAAYMVSRFIENSYEVKDLEFDVSISYGWSTKASIDEETNDILKQAEAIMYRRKMHNDKSHRSSVIKTIMNTLYIKNPREQRHSARVSDICVQIGEALGLSNEDIRELKTAGSVHDIGKIAIDESVLNKTGKLNKMEWEQIKRHPEVGYTLLKTTKEFGNIADVVYAHHEKWDGSGYPRNLKGNTIPLKSRIIAVADAYDAMISDRPYRKPKSKKQAVDEINKYSGRYYDPEIAAVFIEKVINPDGDKQFNNDLKCVENTGDQP